MRIGISVTSHHGDVPPARAVANVIERAQVAAAANLDHLSLGDHHSTGPGNYVQNVPLIGRIMADWPTEGWKSCSLRWSEHKRRRDPGVHIRLIAVTAPGNLQIYSG